MSGAEPGVFAPTPGPLDQARVNALLQRMESEGPAMPDASTLLERVGSAKRKASCPMPPEPDCSTSGEPDMDNKGDLCERARKMQDKNRKAQARYRQRQREKMEGLDGEVGALRSQADELRKANEQLQEQLRKQLEAAEHRHPAPCPGCAQRAAQQASAFLPFLSRGPGLGAGRGCQQAVSCGSSLAPHTESGTQEVPEVKLAAFSIFHPHIAKVFPGSPVPPEELAQKISAADWYLVYKSFVGELAAHLQEIDSESEASEEARLQLDRMIIQKRQITAHTAVTMTPEKLELKCSMGLEPQRRWGPFPPSMWGNVATSARLSHGQKQALLVMRRDFLARLQGIIHQRRRVISELQLAVPGDNAGTLTDGTISKALWASKHLSESIQQEHSIVWGFLFEMCHKLMTPLQEARTMVASFPFFPDPPAICNAIAAECTGSPMIAQEQAAMASGAARNSLPLMSSSDRASDLEQPSDTSTAQPRPPNMQQPSASIPSSGVQGPSVQTGLAGPVGRSGAASLGHLAKGWGPHGQPLLLDSTWVAGLPDLQWSATPGQ